MNRHLLRALLALYPRAWRDRYGAELASLTEELISAGEIAPLPAMVNLAGGAALERGRVLVGSRRAAVAARRFFRAPLLLTAVAMLLLLFVLDYANSGTSYQKVDTTEIASLINQGQVKSALITDKNQTIQITTKSGKQLEALWISSQGLQLQNALQAQLDKGTLPDGYNVNIPKSNALLDVLPTALTYLVIFLLFFFMLAQTGLTAAALFAGGKVSRAASRVH
jgi:hypothetical protein